MAGTEGRPGGRMPSGTRISTRTALRPAASAGHSTDLLIGRLRRLVIDPQGRPFGAGHDVQVIGRQLFSLGVALPQDDNAIRRQWLGVDIFAVPPKLGIVRFAPLERNPVVRLGGQVWN